MGARENGYIHCGEKETAFLDTEEDSEYCSQMIKLYDDTHGTMDQTTILRIRAFSIINHLRSVARLLWSKITEETYGLDCF